MTEELVVRDLDFEGFALPLLVSLELVGGDESEGFVGCFGGENVTE